MLMKKSDTAFREEQAMCILKVHSEAIIAYKTDFYVFKEYNRKFRQFYNHLRDAEMEEALKVLVNGPWSDFELKHFADQCSEAEETYNQYVSNLR
jgi:hypothetical protein